MDKTNRELDQELFDLIYTPTVEEQNAIYIQVGRFFQTWATLESVMNTVIAGALKAKFEHWLIVTANLGVAEKIKIIRSFITASSLSDADRESFDDAMIAIDKLSQTRNIIAHCMFFPDPGNRGTIFYNVKADKKLKQVEKRISKEEFEKMESDMLSYSVKLNDLRDQLMTTQAGFQPFTYHEQGQE